MLRSAPPAIRLGTAARSIGGGAPLPDTVRPALENGFGVDLAPVRVHTDTRAQSAARSLSARAFAFGPDIFLGPGELPVDLRLMAHESAHVLQQQRTTAVLPWSPSGTNRYEAEANRASLAVASGGRFTVSEQLSGPRVQRAESGKTLNYLADQANLIPGFRLFTIILGANPINDQRVDRSAANILRAMFEFLPGGTLISEALANNGVFDKVGAWVEQQLQSLGLVGGQIKVAIGAFIDSLGIRDLFDFGGVWNRAKRIFTEPVERILIFAKGLVTKIVKFIKEAILLPLARLAQRTRGWDLLIAVLGKNPITDEVVPQTAENLIGGFMKLIGEDEVWENMKKANAVSRAWAWFQGALVTVVGFVRMVPQLFLTALASLELADIVLVPRAYVKVGRVFAGFVVQFVAWAGGAVWRLLEIIFESVKPGALDYIKKTGAALKTILKNPLPFVGNLVKAAKLGFMNFADHFGTHLKAGLIDWLTGSLPGVYIPKGFALVEIVKFALSVLGISWANIRGKLVKVVGEPAVTAMETGFVIVKRLVTEGPAAAWEEIKDQLSGLKDQVIGGIISMVAEMIAKKAIPKLIAMFIPGAGFLSAIISIYETVMVFVEKIKKIVEVVTSFVDSIVAIAGGAIGAAANRVESALAGLVSLAIGFLAGFAGLGKVSDKVMGVIQKVRGTIDKGIDKLIAWIVKMAKKLFALPGSKTGGGSSGAMGRQAANAVPDVDSSANLGDEPHTIRVHLAGNSVVILMASGPFDRMHAKLQIIKTTYAAPFREVGINDVAASIEKQVDAVDKLVVRGERDLTRRLVGVTDPGKRAIEFFQQANLTSRQLSAALVSLGRKLTSGKLGKRIFGACAKLKPGDAIVFLATDRAMIVRTVKQMEERNGNFELLFRAESADGQFKTPLLYREEGISWGVVNKPHSEAWRPEGLGGRVVIDKAHLNSGGIASHNPPFLNQTINGKTYSIRGHVVAQVFGGHGRQGNIVALTTTANERMRSGVEVPLAKEIRANDSVYIYIAHPVVIGGLASAPVLGVEIDAERIYPNKTPRKTLRASFPNS